MQNSYWPELLGADTARTHGVRKSILITTTAVPIVAVLIAIAGVITPLSLYDALEASGSSVVSFAYTKDASPFGAATPSRSNLLFSRICDWGHGLIAGPAPCPYSEFPVIITWNGTTYDFNMPFGYSTSIPQTVRDIYSSGTKGVRTTVSNYFDIEWRQVMTNNDEYLNNGSAYLVGTYRQIESMILDDAIKPIEGLVVDTKSGGLGFRNHTLPVGLRHGATWTEDLLFIEPETECVDTNLTIDFTVANKNETLNATDGTAAIFLTDRGGFANLNHTYPYYDRDHADTNPDLRVRAYKAAWMNNAWTMLYLNVTNPNNSTYGNKSFSYVNSQIGKTFEMPTGGSLSPQNALGVSTEWGNYLSGSVLASSGEPGAYPNPFNITRDNFTLICMCYEPQLLLSANNEQAEICSGAGLLDIANITNIFVLCGLVRGPPQRVDNGSPLVWDSGSKWSSPMYACASAVKATIKTVSFQLNGTDGLRSLSILNVKDKSYKDKGRMPLWGVEDSGKTVDQITPVWGLISPIYENYPNISTVRQPSLYIPGYAGGPSGISGLGPYSMYQNLPASDFFRYAMSSVFGTSTLGFTVPTVEGGSRPFTDYSSYSSVALFQR